ncbi:uncharacterized protein LOC144115125 [Amblyomma americanum]
MHSTKWYSQPTKRRIGHGNVLLAAAILFTGCSPTQSLRLVENAGICSFSKRTYDRIPKDILFPAVYQVAKPTVSLCWESISHFSHDTAWQNSAIPPSKATPNPAHKLLVRRVPVTTAKNSRCVMMVM